MLVIVMLFPDGEPRFMLCKDLTFKKFKKIYASNFVHCNKGLMFNYCFFSSEPDKVTIRKVRTRMD